MQKPQGGSNEGLAGFIIVLWEVKEEIFRLERSPFWDSSLTSHRTVIKPTNPLLTFTDLNVVRLWRYI